MSSALDALPDKASALDSLPEKQSALDSLPEKGPALDFHPDRKLAPALQRGVDVGMGTLKKGLFGGLSILGWPFERASAVVGTPIAQYRKAQERIKTELGERPIGMPSPGSSWNARLRGSGLYTKRYDAEARIRREAALEGTKALAKSLISKELPEEATTVTDVGADIYTDYYKFMLGEEPPSWLPHVMGGTADFLVAPWLLGKTTKGLTAAVKTPFRRYDMPQWRRMKLRTRAKTGARIERATELGKTVQPRRLKEVAADLSRRTGTKITPEAVGLRISQIAKGGITEQRALQKLSNPIIAEFRNNARELQRLGILGTETYTTKLPRRRITELLAEKAKLQTQLDKLGVVPGQVKLSELVGKLKVSQPKLAEQIFNTAVRIETKSPELSQRLSRVLDIQASQPDKLLSQLVRIENAGLAERGRLVGQLESVAVKAQKEIPQQILNIAMRIEKKNPEIGNRLSRILTLKTTQPQRLLNDLARIEKAGLAERNRLIGQLESLAVKAESQLPKQILDVVARIEKKSPDLGKRLSRIVGTKAMQPDDMLSHLAKIEKAGLTERSRLINELENLAVKVEKQRVIGLSPLEKRVSSMKRTFPGKAKKAQELQNKMDDITQRIQTSYKTGGTEYFPRFYTGKEAERAAIQWPMYGPQRIRAPYAKQRKNIPFEARKEMGEILQPAYPVMKRQIQQAADIELAKLFRQVAGKSEWVDDVWRPGFAEKALPVDKKYGALAGKFLNKRVHNDITELVRIPGNVEQLYDTLIGAWKLGKVVLSPATHMRNKMSNKILLDLSGMGYGEQAKYALRALSEYKRNSREYQLAKNYFARTTHVRGEIMGDILKTNIQAKGSGFEKALQGVRGGIKHVVRKPAELYQHEEFTNKFMKYLQQRDQGKSVIQAVEEGNKWLFDYSELSRFETNVMRRVMPFYTFPRKALPRVAEAVATRPHTVAKYPLIAKSTTQYALSKLELTDKDYAQIEKIMPEYMQTGSYILMPYRDDNGDLRFFDWTYILPWGEIAEVQHRGVLRSVVTNPLVQIVADIQRNKSSWTEREIWMDTDTRKEKFYKRLEYTWKNLMPALAPKGLYWDKLHDAVTKKPTKHGDTVLLPETIAHTIGGLRTQALDEQKQRRFYAGKKQAEFNEMSKKLVDITQRRASGNITENEYQKKREQYMKQIKALTSNL